jgi:hypothetical protein
MWIVRLALRRPYTFVVMAIAIGGGWEGKQPEGSMLATASP